MTYDTSVLTLLLFGSILAIVVLRFVVRFLFFYIVLKYFTPLKDKTGMSPFVAAVLAAVFINRG